MHFAEFCHCHFQHQDAVKGFCHHQAGFWQGFVTIGFSH